MSYYAVTTKDVQAALSMLRASNVLEEPGTSQDIVERGAILALESLLAVQP
jgi:hypothetical protein